MTSRGQFEDTTHQATSEDPIPKWHSNALEMDPFLGRSAGRWALIRLGGHVLERRAGAGIPMILLDSSW